MLWNKRIEISRKNTINLKVKEAAWLPNWLKPKKQWPWLKKNSWRFKQIGTRRKAVFLNRSMNLKINLSQISDNMPLKSKNIQVISIKSLLQFQEKTQLSENFNNRQLNPKRNTHQNYNSWRMSLNQRMFKGKLSWKNFNIVRININNKFRPIR